MKNVKVKRSQIATFVNTSSTTGASYQLLGVGVVTGKVAMNPKITEETYIHEDSATKIVESYAPTLPIEMTAHAGEPIFDYIDNLRQNRAVLDDAVTDIVNVNYYQSSNTSGYPAEKQSVAISIEDGPGGDGGSPAKISFTFNYVGNGLSGRFNVSSNSFYAN
jgi:hypothetical protein